MPTDPAAIEALIPAPADPARSRRPSCTTSPRAGHLANTDAIEQLIEGAQRRLDVMCPYSADQGIFERMMDAARRGVKVRFVDPPSRTSGRPPPRSNTGTRTSRPTGVEVWLHPVLPHAKVVLADDRVLIGTTNLDAWALYRNWEMGLLFEDAAVAETVRRELFDRDVAASRPAERQSDTLIRARNWFMALISPLL